MNKTRLLTFEDVAAQLIYEPETGVFMRARATHRGRAGSVIGGTINNMGYTVLCIGRRPVLAHRLAFMLMNKRWPADQLDHINRDRADNRWANLREATLAQNNANAVKTRTRDLPTGVKRQRRPKDRPYQAVISIGGRSTYLGSFADPQEAHRAYLEARHRIHGEFAPQP